MLVCAAFVGLTAALLLAGVGEARAAGTVTVAVTGQGSASGVGIDCTQSGGPDCSEFYADTEECEFDPETRQNICFDVPPEVTLTAGLDTNGYVYDSWTGCDSTAGRECYLTVTGDRAVTARFLDAQAPSVGSVSPAGVRRGIIGLAASASDNSGMVSRVEFRVRGALVGTDTSAPFSVDFNTTMVADGAATIRATAFDAAGNSSFADSTITIDNTAPTVGITAGPNGQTFSPGTTQTWTFSASDATSGVASVQCSVVAEGSAPSFGSCSGGSTSHSVSNRPDGDYTFTVRATDNAGLQSAATRSFSIDATAPSLAVTGPDGGEFAGGDTLAWDINASDGGSGIASVQCSVVRLGSPHSFGDCSDGATGHSLTGLASGEWELAVRATDGMGLQTTELRSFSIDATPPDTTITGGPKKRTKRKRATFFFTSNEAEPTFRCRLDGGAWRSCSSPASFRVGTGRHRFQVRARDAVGNLDPTPAAYTWKVRRKRR